MFQTSKFPVSFIIVGLYQRDSSAHLKFVTYDSHTIEASELVITTYEKWNSRSRQSVQLTGEHVRAGVGVPRLTAWFSASRVVGPYPHPTGKIKIVDSVNSSPLELRSWLCFMAAGHARCGPWTKSFCAHQSEIKVLTLNWKSYRVFLILSIRIDYTWYWGGDDRGLTSDKFSGVTIVCQVFEVETVWIILYWNSL